MQLVASFSGDSWRYSCDGIVRVVRTSLHPVKTQEWQRSDVTPTSRHDEPRPSKPCPGEIVVMADGGAVVQVVRTLLHLVKIVKEPPSHRRHVMTLVDDILQVRHSVPPMSFLPTSSDLN